MSSSVSRITLLLALLLTAFSGMVVQPTPASAATLTVSDCDRRTFINTVGRAGSGDTVRFSCSGVIALGFGIDVFGKDITIDGSGQDVTITGGERDPNIVYGALFNVNRASLTLKNLSIANAGGFHGRAIESTSSSVTVINCTFLRHRPGAVMGGAILHHDGPLTVINSTFTENLGYDGGAIRSTFGAVTITNSTFNGNMAERYGGAVYVNAGSLDVSNSTFSGNEIYWSGGAGAAIWVSVTSSAPATITNSTISGNKSGSGGAITTLRDMNVTHSTFHANTTAQFGFGSGLYIEGGTTTMTNSIMVNHPRRVVEGGGNYNGGCVNHSTFVDGGGNLADDGGGGNSDAGYCSFPGNGNQAINLDPAGLQLNGGLTKTIALQNVSSAKGAALHNCTATDQRGAPRPERCDSGAYQSGAAPALVDDPPLSSCDAGSLRNAIAVAKPGTTVLFRCSGTITLTSAGGGPITLNKDLKIDGRLYPVTVTGAGGSAFVVMQGSTVTMEAFTIAHGVDSGMRNAGTLHLNEMSFNGNHAGDNGGAVYNAGTVDITNSTISGNSAAGGGGVANYGQMTVVSSTISGNNATGGGGGINYGQLAVVNSTVSGNSASAGGGGVANIGQLTVINSTFSGNSATAGGGALLTQTVDAGNPATSTLANTLLAGSPAGGECNGAVIDQGGNLASDASCALTNTSSVNSSATLAATLSQLGNYGGPTQTIALLDGSPALVSGVFSVCTNPPVGSIDQRGYPRRVPTCASGAFDPATAPTFLTATTSPTSPITGQPTKLSVFIGLLQRPDLRFIDGGGTVSFYLETMANPIAGCTDVPISELPCTYTFPEAGSYTILATYSGEVRYGGSQDSLTVTVADEVEPVFETTGSSPYTAKAGSAGFTLTVTGNQFTPDSVVHLDGVPLVTHFGSDTQLTADVPANLTAHTAVITVVNPPPDNEISNPQVLIITITGAGLLHVPVIASGTNPSATIPDLPYRLNAGVVGTGTGTVVLAVFASNPSGVSSYGTDRYINAFVLPGSDFSQVTIRTCDLNGGNQLRWWSGTAWDVAAPQLRLPVPCQVVTTDSTSTPTIAQLNGTPFAVTNTVAEVLVPVAQSVEYGSALSFDISAIGAVAGDTVTIQADGLPAGLAFTDNGDGTGRVSGTVTDTAGLYTASFTASVDENSSVVGTVPIDVIKAPLTITASNATMIYGDPVPAITPGFAGFVLDDTAASLFAQPTCGTGYSPGSLPVGSYATTCAGAASATYAISYQDGTLDVTSADQSITLDFSTLAPRYGDSPFDIRSSGSASSGLPVSFSSITPDVCSISGSMVTLLAAGTCTINANQSGDANYEPAPEVQQHFEVAKANLSISANDATMTFGGAVPVFGATPTGLVNGDSFEALGGTCAAEVAGEPVTATTPTGVYPAAITCSGVQTANYSVTYTPGTLTVGDAPVITSDPATTFTVGVDVSFTIMASGVPNATFSTEGPLPGGVTLSSDGVLSGAPAAGTEGIYTFEIVASNGIAPDARQTFSLTVVVPEIIAPDDISVPNDTGYAGAFVAYPAPQTIGQVGEVTCTPESGSFFALSTTTVSCVSSLTTATASFTVTVVDTTPPTIVAPANIELPPTDSDGAIVTYPAPVVTDNAPGATAVCAPSSGSRFAIGVTTVTCTATDVAGNTASASFTVSVIGGAALLEQLKAMINELPISGSAATATSIRQNLLAMVELAQTFDAANQPGMTCLMVTRIDLEILSQTSKRRIQRRDAEELYAQTATIHAAIGCGTR